MTNKISSALFILIVGVVFSCVTPTVQATVGGPTFVYDLKYNASDSSVYYTKQDGGGKGCPPELHKILLTTLEKSTVISCDQGIENSGDMREEIAFITAQMKDLTQLHLSKNNFEIKVFTGEAKTIAEGWVSERSFVAQVFQDGNFISEIKLTGCEANQSFTFAGYAIPSLTKRIALLVSAKGDCFEGGYTTESLHVINDITIYDRAISGTPKSNTDLKPTTATLSVSAKMPDDHTKPPAGEQNVISPLPFPTPVSPPSTGPRNEITIALIAGIFLIVGVVLGHHTKR